MKTSEVFGLGVAAVTAAVVLLALNRGEDVKAAPIQMEAPRTACVDAPPLVCDALDLSQARGASRYRRVEVNSTVCTTTLKLRDGGTATVSTENLPTPDAGRLLVLRDSCVPAAEEVGTRLRDGGVKFAAQRCFCRRASGACTAAWLIDGGTATVPFGMTARDATGAGCQPKSCVELWGESSWPAACPER